jgi:hypothetical protein
MLRKVLLTIALLAIFATSAFAGGQLDQEIPQMTQHIVEDNHDGMPPEVLAALILGGLGLTGAVITALVASRRRKG